MAVKRKKKDQPGVPEWVVTFGDMMSLLLTFFVLLFTYSTMDAVKYKALAGSIREAFGSSIVDQLRGMVEVGGLATRDKPTTMLIPPAEKKSEPGIPEAGEKPAIELKIENSEKPVVQVEIDEAGQKLIEQTYQSLIRK